MSEIHEFGGFRGGNTGFHSILVENCIKSSQYGGNRRINQRFPNYASLVKLLKHYPVSLIAVGEIAQAISSAGGVKQSALDEKLMLTTKPGVFCVGEMLDWEAPTGGYLLTASLATARWAAQGVAEWLK